MTTKKIEIERYIPSQELVINVLNHSESIKYSTFIYGSIAFLALLFSFVFWSAFPFLLTATFLVFFIKYQSNPFLKQGIFTSNTLELIYKIGFIEWTKEHELNSGIDWFVDLKRKPIMVQIGTNGKILLDFELANEHELPPLTDKISALTKMNFDENQTANNYEVLRFRPQNQLPANPQFNLMQVKKTSTEIRIIMMDMKKPFWIDLQKEILYYNKWFSEKSIPLRHIGRIYYETQNYSTADLTAKWYFYDKQTQEEVLFFSLDVIQTQNMENAMDSNYRALNFKSDLDNLKSLLKEIPALANIEIEGK
jgi:hypothetical protein